MDIITNVKWLYITDLSISLTTGSHAGTGIKPLKWTVNKEQTMYLLCACKYTRDPPYCDATHTNLPCQVLDRQEKCAKKSVAHKPDNKLCTGCGWVPDFWWKMLKSRLQLLTSVNTEFLTLLVEAYWSGACCETFVHSDIGVHLLHHRLKCEIMNFLGVRIISKLFMF